jgi:hypothetical protein
VYSSPSDNRAIKWAGFVTSMGKFRKEPNMLTGKPKGEKPFRRHGCRWENHTVVPVKGIVCDNVVDSTGSI